MIPDLFSRLILPFILGAAIGFERSATDLGKSSRKRVPFHNVGVRTFSLTATLGAISGMIYGLAPGAALVLMCAILLLILLYYVLHGISSKDAGITTELALIYTFATGVVLSIGILPPTPVIASTVVVTLLLSKKREIETFILGLAPREVSAFISYALIALVVLPFLPNRYFTLGDFPVITNLFGTYGLNGSSYVGLELINPYRLWFIVALVTGVDFIGHFIERFTGSGRGRLFAGFLGGFVSSTATTQSLAVESKQVTQPNSLIAAAILANMASFIQLFLLLAGTNSIFTVRATPLILLLIISSGVLAVFFARGGAPKKPLRPTKVIHKTSEIISLVPALQFAMLFVFVRLCSKLSLIIFGQAGFLATSALAALTGIDAVVINTAEMVGKSIDVRLGVMTIILVNAVNLTAKSVYSFLQGSRPFAIGFAKSMGFVILISLLSLAV